MIVGDDMAGRIPDKAGAALDRGLPAAGKWRVATVSRAGNLNYGRRSPIENGDGRAFIVRQITTRLDWERCGRRVKSFHDIGAQGDDYQHGQDRSKDQAIE